MSTTRTPLRVLQAEANKIAAQLKAIDRGERVSGPYAEKVEAARGNPALMFGIVMDDKVIQVEMPWSKLRETSEAALSAWLLRYMKGTRADAVH